MPWKAAADFRSVAASRLKREYLAGVDAFRLTTVRTAAIMTAQANVPHEN